MGRKEFLARVGASVAAQSLPDPGPNEDLALPSDSNELEYRFRANLEALEGSFHGTLSPRDVTTLVLTLLRQNGTESFMSWDAEHLPSSGLLDGLAAAGMQRVDDLVPADGEARQTHQMGYFDVSFGITGASAALAETGSIVVASGPGRPRMASLIPDVHIAIVRVDRVWPTLRHWIADHHDAAAAVANWTVITGPSRTADIEQVLTRGVHGPREIHVVFV